MLSKDQLEQLIAQDREVGDFVFEEQNQCFTTDAEVLYELIELDQTTFCSGEFIYFDGYEYSMEEGEKKIYTGSLAEVAEQIAAEYVEENHFMGYPVIYTNFQVQLVAQ